MSARAGIKDGQVVATITDKFGEERQVVQRGSRIRIASNQATPIIAMNREISILMGQKIKAARIKAGLSLEECAIRAGVVSGWPKNRMFEIENAKRAQGLRLGTLYALAAALNVEVADLLPSRDEVLAKADVKKARMSVVTLSSAGRVVS